MKENQTTVTKQETLEALRHPGELYVIMSAATKMPFVFCDEDTYDDQVFLYYRLEDAKNKIKELEERKYKTGAAKLEEKILLGFYTSLYTMGVNCLAVNEGTDTAISIQLADLVVRKNPEQMEEGKKLLENPFDCAVFYAGTEAHPVAGDDGSSERTSGRTACALSERNFYPCGRGGWSAAGAEAERRKYVPADFYRYFGT